jgi:hypothetical protein
MGFENSFADATPIRSRSGHSRSKKETEASAHASHRREISPTSPIPFPQTFADIKMSDPQDLSEELTGSGTVGNERFGNEGMPIEDFQEVEPFNWKAEVFSFNFFFAGFILKISS